MELVKTLRVFLEATEEQFVKKNRLITIYEKANEVNSFRNYVLLFPRKDSQTVVKELKEKKVWIRDYGRGILKGWIRVSTGAKSCMERFWEALQEVEGVYYKNKENFLYFLQIAYDIYRYVGYSTDSLCRFTKKVGRKNIYHVEKTII